MKMNLFRFSFGFLFLFVQNITGQEEFEGNGTKVIVGNAPIHKAKKDAIKGQYIVVFNEMPNLRRDVDSFHRDYEGGQKVIHHFEDHIGGYSAKIDDELLEEIRKDPRIKYIEEDRIMKIFDCSQSEAAQSWHLSRITSRQNSVAGQTYKFNPTSGSGVTVYVIDTGINPTHVDFEGRATAAATFVEDDSDFDTNGHGTCVAGVIAGRTFGVSKAANIVSLKVFGSEGQGSTSGILAAMNWAIRDHRQNPGQKSIINMSLGGGYSYALNDLADKCVRAGIPVVVAAGNEGQDACQVSPASASQVLTVGATDSSDLFASYSNYGRCVNVLAPGSDVNCPWIGSDTAIKQGISGTSFSSPCVAGYGAYLLSRGSYDASSLYRKIIRDATPNVINRLRAGTVNKLLYNSCP